MNNKLVSFSLKENVGIHTGNFLIPADWTSRGVAVHLGGGPGLGNGQPVALAINKNALTLCSHDGPVVSVAFSTVRDVRVVDLSGMAMPIRTPSGIIDMVPDKAKGFAVRYEFNPMGGQIDLSLYTFTPRSSYEWVQVIQEAIYDNLSGFRQAGS